MRLYSIPALLCLALAAVPPRGWAADVTAHSFGSGGNCQGVWRLPDTGQTASYTATSGEDHDYQPAASQMSYTVLNPVGISSVTVDNVTGLIWVTNPVDAGISGLYTWENALGACESLNYAGYSDWRLPNIQELASIVDFGATSSPCIKTSAFLSTAGQYWASTTHTTTSNAWTVPFSNGDLVSTSKSSSAYVRCVRGPY